MGSLLPLPGQAPKYAQLYILDKDVANEEWRRRNSNLDPSVMLDLDTMLQEHNPFVQLYKKAHQIMAEKPPEEQANVQAQIILADGTDPRRYNLPTTEEVAAIIPGSGEQELNQHRDIILRLQGGGLRRISQIHPLYSPLHYVLLFPRGDQGWHTNIPMHGPNTNGKKVTQRCYYAHRLFPRLIEPDTIFRGERLFQQYVVDAWASVEQSELFWVQNNQKKIRADLYQGLKDVVEDSYGSDNVVDMAQQGKRIVLPSSHSGSPRHMFQLFQDSMAICRRYQKPDLFVTMTANPKWPEIQDELLKIHSLNNEPGRHQTAPDRPDIVARVFHQKKEALLKEIKDGMFL
jgi:hypothetical protein